MREMITVVDARARGITRSERRQGLKTGRWVNAGYGVLALGPEPVTTLDKSVAAAKATLGAVSGTAAGELFKLDSVTTRRVDFTVPPGASNAREGARRRFAETTRLDGIRVVAGTQTLLDLAACLDDLTWEQALESALRKALTSIAAIEEQLPLMSATRTSGVRRIRRVLALRPAGAPPTESLLETLAIQLFRSGGLPTPTRQVVVCHNDGRFVARVDLAWPELGVFVELDGQHHAGQPVYDASRQTAVVAVTGWLPARFTWLQIVRHPEATLREMRTMLASAKRLRQS